MVKILLLGTHDYEWCIKPFSYLFKKYYGNDKIVYVADYLLNDLADNIEYLQVPAYSEGIWNWHEWFSNGLKSIFEYFDNELCLIFLLDHFISQKVNLNYLNQLSEYMLNHPNIVRGNLTTGTCLDGYGKIIDRYEDLDIITIPANHRHCSFGGGITFCPSIFNGNNMIKILGNHWSFHATEKVGTEVMATTQLKSVGTKQAILYRTHALHHCKKSISLVGLNENDKSVIKEMIPDGMSIEE